MVLTCYFYKDIVKLFIPPCKVLKQMGGRDSVHYLWPSLQDAVDIKLDWNGASGVKLPFCLNACFYILFEITFP